MSLPGSQDGSNAHCCEQCGHDLQRSANFCPHCGTAVGASYCPDCGEPFVDSAVFCSSCGSERPTAAESAHHAKKSETYEQFRHRVASYTDAGWEITADHGDRVTVVDRDIGSIGIHVLLLLLTSGFLNIVYGWYHYSKQAETRQLVVGGIDASSPTDTFSEAEPTMAGTTQGTMAYVTAGLLWVISLALLFVAIGGSSLAAGLIGLLFAAGGSYVFPPAKRRFARRLPVTTFGRHKTVDHRIVRPTGAIDEPCVVCGTEVDGGLVRRRRDETVVAGIPVRSHQLETNHYCAACAHSEFVDSELDGHAEITDRQTETATTSK